MIHPADLKTSIAVLQAIARDRGILSEIPEEDRVALLTAAGQVARPDGIARRRLARAFRQRDETALRVRDERALLQTGIRSARREAVFVPPPRVDPPASAGLLERPRACYVCKEPFRELHAFYDALCPPCAAFNYEKRFQTADLRGQVALVTGARIKIGYQVALMLLRAGARVLVTTRFPHDAAGRFAREPDFASFADRLELHGLDLRHAPSVERFAAELSGRLPRLDVIVNNAAQTVRRPAGFYAHLLPAEERALAELPPLVRPLLAAHHERRAQGTHAPAALVAWQEAWDAAAFPAGALDADLQQIDLRPVNTWRLPAAEVPTPELLEVHLVNAIAPFILVARLKPLMRHERTDARHVINVSAMEAQFSRRKKTDKHPHTNMAKAALNMLTRTSAVEYAADGIFMNSVDTGWITDEDPHVHVERKQRVHGFHPPLDIVDGAARVLDPLFSGLNSGHHPWGLFFKDYRPVEW
jgi:NAD(P)-dependent dehydrogenase (short-subunit alcohol dehydrogenase family)